MHTSINQALAIYKQECELHFETIKPILANLEKDDPSVKISSTAQLGMSQLASLRTSTLRLEAMEKVLGLSKKEVKKIQDEINIKINGHR